jgi:hypothetical protein
MGLAHTWSVSDGWTLRRGSDMSLPRFSGQHSGGCQTGMESDEPLPPLFLGQRCVEGSRRWLVGRFNVLDDTNTTVTCDLFAVDHHARWPPMILERNKHSPQMIRDCIDMHCPFPVISSHS